MNGIVRKGIRIETISIIWMIIEALVSIIAGVAAASMLLTAFGIDSIIELISAGALLWRLQTESEGASLHKVERAERLAQWVVAIALGLLCCYVLVTSVYGIIVHIRPDNSLAGIIVSLIAVVGMPYLAKRKKNIAGEIGSKALEGDAACSIVCAYMAGTVLVGLGLNLLFQWWWAEYIAALLFLYWLFQETREAFMMLRKKSVCRCK